MCYSTYDIISKKTQNSQRYFGNNQGSCCYDILQGKIEYIMIYFY